MEQIWEPEKLKLPSKFSGTNSKEDRNWKFFVGPGELHDFFCFFREKVSLSLLKASYLLSRYETGLD